jgi:glycosyltransferase involved in cell wall biosynthesis
VVIPTGGRSPHLARIVARLLEDAAREVVVVDDRPAAADGAPLPLPADERVRTVITGGRGPAAARQAGTEQARGDIVLLLDHDVVPEPGLVAGHAARHAAADGGLVVVGAMPVDLSAPAAGPAFPRVLYARDYERRVGAYERGGEVLTHLWAGNVSLRRADALAVGLVSPRYRGYRHEDQEFGLRCRAAGLRGMFAPELAARHLYERAPAAFFADARAQGREQLLLRNLYPATVTPLTAGAFLKDLPPGLRPVVALARRRRGAAALRRVLGTAVALSADAPGVQLRLAQVLRRVEQVDGASRPGMGE